MGDEFHINTAPYASDFEEVEYLRNLKIHSEVRHSSSIRAFNSFLILIGLVFTLMPFSKQFLRISKVFLPLWPKSVQSYIHRLHLNYLLITRGTNRSEPNYSMDMGFGILTSDTPKVSILIPVFNQMWFTLRCLLSIQKISDVTPFEIIVINDGSTDETYQLLKSIRGIRILNLRENIGYLRAVNAGAKYARGENILLLNNDTEVLNGWVDNLIKTIIDYPDVAIVGSKLLNEDESLQEAGGIIFSNGNAWNLGRNQNAYDEIFMFAREVDYCSAASILIRKAFWDEVAGFDLRFVPAYCEDSDICLEAWKRGYRVMFQPLSVVRHFEGKSHGISTKSGIKRFQKINSAKLLEKRFDELQQHWDLEIPRFEFARTSKGIVIVLDRQLPVRFRDAGSVRTLELISAIQSIGYHVILGAIDSSCTWEQKYQLNRKGVEVYFSFNELLSSLEVRKSRIKFCWSIRKEVISFLTPEITKRVPGVNLITDLLDLNYWCDASGKIHIDTSQLKVLDSINPVVLVSKKECNILSDILPKGKAFQLWAPYAPIKLEKPLSQSGREGLIFVGGFRHKPNCEAIEWFRSSVWPKLLENGYSETVRIVGTGMPTKLLEECLDSGFKVLGRVDNLDEQYLSSKIAILPLLSGRGRKGKLGEALSFGMPIIGTSVAFEDFDLKSGVEAFEANSDYEWVDAITKLSSDEKIRETLSCNALNYCASNLSREVFASRIVDILETSSSRRLGVTHA